jgi:hypothetical protein
MTIPDIGELSAKSVQELANLKPHKFAWRDQMTAIGLKMNNSEAFIAGRKKEEFKMMNIPDDITSIDVYFAKDESRFDAFSFKGNENIHKGPHHYNLSSAFLNETAPIISTVRKQTFKVPEGQQLLGGVFHHNEQHTFGV